MMLVCKGLGFGMACTVQFGVVSHTSMTVYIQPMNKALQQARQITYLANSFPDHVVYCVKFRNRSSDHLVNPEILCPHFSFSNTQT